MRVEQQSGGTWRVIGAQGWGVGVDFPSEADAQVVANVIEAATTGDAAATARAVYAALDGDSNDAEHDALVQVANLLGETDDGSFDEPSPDPNWMNP